MPIKDFFTKTTKKSDAEGSEARKIVEDIHSYANQYRREQESRLKTNYEMYKKGVKASRTKSKNKYTANLVFSTVENKTAFITDHRPKFVFLPSSGQSVQLAESFSNVIGDYAWEEASLESKIRKIAKSGSIFGDGVGKTFFNTTTGDMDLKPLSILKFHPDPMMEDIREGQFVGYHYPLPVEYIKWKFRKNVKPSNLVPELEFDQNKTIRGVSKYTQISMVREYWINDFSTSERELEEYNEATKEFEVKKEWIRNYPRGRVIMLADDGTVLVDSPNPLPIQMWHPFIHFGYYPIEGKFWNMGEPDIIEPVVKDFTDLIKQVIANAKLMANGKTIVNTASGIRADDVTNDAGDVYESNIDARAAMHTDYGTAMPQYIMVMTEFLTDLVDKVIGNTDVFQGIMPKGAPSGITVDFLQEASSRRTRETAKNLEETLTQLGRNFRDMITLYDPDKLFYVAGMEGWETIRRDNLTGKYTVRVQAGSTMATSYAAKQERAIRMFQAQLIDQITALEMIGDPYTIKAAQRIAAMIGMTATPNLLETEEEGRGSKRYQKAVSEAHKE